MPFRGHFAVTCCVLMSAAAPIQAQTLNERLLAEAPDVLAAAARSSGDAQRGAILFHQPTMACTKCHAVGGRENSLGPDLTRLPDDATDVHVVDSVLRPSKTIRKGYAATTLLMTDGRTVTGIPIDSADATSVQLRDPSTSRVLTFAIAEIDEQATSLQSIMPPQQVNQMASRQQFLDLLAYVIAIRDGGPAKARELQPPAALFALKLPEYEDRVDHAGLLHGLDEESFNRGQAIYERLCINCHGDHERPGSLPTALRFAEGKFKNGSDPFTMYQTLTRGFGFMVPQPWMVPQQKYDVIHYMREAYLRKDNPSQFAAITDAYLADLPQGDTRGPRPRKYEPWSDMNYGPQLVGTYEIPGTPAASSGEEALPRKNIAYKGIAVRLDPGAGGVAHGNAWMIFDHDTMRMAGAWTASNESRQRFIDWQGIHFNGRHGTHPTVVGDVHWSNPTGPGWAHPETGSFDDDQRILGRDGRQYGPLPRDWARFHGFHACEEKTILSYSIGETDILEMPNLVTVGRNSKSVHAGKQSSPTDFEVHPTEMRAFTRSFNIGPRPRDLTLLVATLPREAAKLRVTDSVAVLGVEPSSSRPTVVTGFDGACYLQGEDAEPFDMETGDFTITARIRTNRGGTILAKTEPGAEWVPGGKVFFVRGGRLCYDTGWVGVVQSEQKIDDGEWHDVAVTRNGRKGLVQLYVDGELAGQRKLAAGEPLESAVIRIGYCAPDFPAGQSAFVGDLEDVKVFARELSPSIMSAGELSDERLIAHWPLRQSPEGWGHDRSSHRRHVKVQLVEGSQLLDRPIVAGMSVAIDGAAWRSDRGRLLLDIPAGAEPLRFVLWTASDVALPDESRLDSEDVVFAESEPDLAALTQQARPRWPERVRTQMVVVDPGGAFAVDELSRPTNNPWLARTRLTGLDFFDDPDRMVVTSWDGDVWLVTGLAAGGESAEPVELTWQRIASGLFQPLGVKVVRGDVYVTCRDQLVILRDSNADGETDFYECFNNDHQVTEHFHEFAMGLQVDEAGNFYYAKSARHALPAVVPHHGTLLRVTPDGKRTDMIANGFRAANGVCLNPDGTFIVTDQEGHWNPKNRINWVTPGVGTGVRFYGNMFGYHDVTDESDAAMEPPLCWITNDFDRSPSELLWVDSSSWGPLNGSLLNFSYGFGNVYVVPHEEVGGLKQGGMCAFPIEQFPTGTMRGRFSPHDGHLYTCGMFAWASSQQAQEGGLYRIRATGKPSYLPIGLEATRRGIAITLTDPLDRDAGSDPQNYAVKVWSLRRTADYGSDHYDERQLAVTDAVVTKDGRSLFLEIPDIAPTWCMEIRLNLVGADGEPFERVIHNTIHRLAK